MPYRILRDCCDSEKVNSLTVHAERHFYRLIMKVDDWGRIYANAKFLRPLLYPWLLEQVREADMQRWNAECGTAGLVRLYEYGGREYLEILDFRQELRTVKGKYPDETGKIPHKNKDGTITYVICGADGTQTRVHLPEETKGKETKSPYSPPLAGGGGSAAPRKRRTKAERKADDAIARGVI